MSYFKSAPPKSFMWPLAFLGIILATGFTSIIDYDIWWHLKTGELIYKWHTIPRFDIFSYTAAGNEWVNHEWLYEVFVWVLCSKLAIATLTFLKFFVTVGISAISYKTVKNLTASQSAAIWATIIILVGVADRITDRPHIFSLLFLAFYCLALHRYASTPSLPQETVSQSPLPLWERVRERGGIFRTLYLLPILQVAWINLHGGGLLGPQLVLAFAFGESVQAIIKGPSPLEWKKIRRLWLIGFACLAASAINPQGIDMLLFSFSHMKMETILAYTQEWLPVLDPRLDIVISQILFRVILVATLISYFVNRQSARLSHLMMTIAMCVLVLKGRRFTADFIIVNLPILFANFQYLAREIPLTKTASAINLRKWCLFLIVFSLSIFTLKHGIPSTIYGGQTGEIGTGITGQFAPENMVNFLDKNEIHGRVYNEMGLGGYLIFRRWPGDLVFIDGRTPVYGDDFYRRLIDVCHRSQNFEALDDEFKFDYLVFKGDQAWEMRNFHKYLWEGKTWKLVYSFPSEGLVYLRDEPQFKELIKKLALKKHPIVEQMREAASRSM